MTERRYRGHPELMLLLLLLLRVAAAAAVDVILVRVLAAVPSGHAAVAVHDDALAAAAAAGQCGQAGLGHCVIAERLFVCSHLCHFAILINLDSIGSVQRIERSK